MPGSARGVAALFTIAIFSGAAMMFVIEPLFAKMLLPLVGGAPALWTASMTFYQLMLLLGYAAAHLIATRLPIPLQALVVGGIFVAGFLVLPVRVDRSLLPPTDSSPVLWITVVMAIRIGLPFFALCMLSPLLQRWYSLARLKRSDDPYFLYAASNFGSMIGLLGYPFLLEPQISTAQTAGGWSWAYIVMALSIIGLSAWMVRSARRAPSEDGCAIGAMPTQALTGRLIGRWVFLAFVPSSMLLGLTTFLTTDVAAVPMFWVIPLALYLLTFMIVFARKVVVPHRVVMALFPFVLVEMFVFLAIPITKPYWLAAGALTLGFFVTCLAAHGELARTRPATEHLTQFYFWIALGGVCGGLFNSLIAPVVFQTALEFALVTILATLIVPAARPFRGLWILGIVLVSIAFAVALRMSSPDVLLIVAVVFLAVLGSAFARRKLVFVASLFCAFVIAEVYRGQFGVLLYQDRSFFGVSRVIQQDRYRYYYHGTTMHGVQDTGSSRELTPLAYYYPTGPMGQIMRTLPEERKKRVCLMGLGVGGLLAYGKKGQFWTILEIDPIVEEIATNPKLYTYLSKTPAETEIILGDARVTLERLDRTYDLLIQDAYSSDSVPAHLLTREALRVYLSRLSPEGLLVYHISNNRIDLEPLVKALCDDAGLVSLGWIDFPSNPFEIGAGKTPSYWIVAAREWEHLAPLRKDGRWEPLEGRKGFRPWTDDSSSIVSLLKL